MTTFTIRGKNVEITPALRDYVEKRIGKITRYFDSVGEISVLLSVLKDRHLVEVTVPVQGVLLRGEEASHDMYASIDLVIEKLERQIHKHKTKMQRRFRDGTLLDEAFAANAAQARVEDEEDESEVTRTWQAFCPRDWELIATCDSIQKLTDMAWYYMDELAKGEITIYLYKKFE